MTVSNQLQYANFAGNGAAAQAFPFTFRCVLNSYLTVEFRNGSTVTTLALNVDYTVTLNPDQEANPGGTVTLTDAVLAAPLAATTIAVYSTAPNVQQLDIPTGGAFPAAAIESQLDNLTQQIQQLRDALASALRARPGDTLAMLPSAAARANTVQGYDAAGAPMLYANLTNVSLVTQVQGPFGTAALPGYSFAGRTSDGMWSPAASALAWSTGGVERLRIDSAGNLGLGTTAPSAASGLALAMNGGAGQARIAFKNAATGNAAGDGMQIGIDGDGVAFIQQRENLSLQLFTNAIERFRIEADGRIFGTALHNNGGPVSGTIEQHIASGTYTPTLTNVANVTASTALMCQWIRVGNVVTVSGQVNIDPTAAAAATRLDLSLPIASNFAIANQLCGTAARDTAGVSNLVAAVRALDTVNDRAAISFLCDADATNQGWAFTFSYVIL